jgi:hypothetical protein
MTSDYPEHLQHVLQWVSFHDRKDKPSRHRLYGLHASNPERHDRKAFPRLVLALSLLGGANMCTMNLAAKQQTGPGLLPMSLQRAQV